MQLSQSELKPGAHISMKATDKAVRFCQQLTIYKFLKFLKMSGVRERFKNFVTFNQQENLRVRNRNNDANRNNDQENRPPQNISYEDSHFRVFVEQAQHKRHSRFNVGDHLFHIKIEPKQNVRLPLETFFDSKKV